MFDGRQKGDGEGAYIASLEQVKQIKRCALNQDRVIPGHIPQDRLDSFHHPLAKQLNGHIITERQHRAELEDVDQGGVVHGAVLARLLPVSGRLRRRDVLGLDLDHHRPVVLGDLVQEGVHQGLQAVAGEGAT